MGLFVHPTTAIAMTRHIQGNDGTCHTNSPDGSTPERHFPGLKTRGGEAGPRTRTVPVAWQESPPDQAAIRNARRPVMRLSFLIFAQPVTIP